MSSLYRRLKQLGQDTAGDRLALVHRLEDCLLKRAQPRLSLPPPGALTPLVGSSLFYFQLSVKNFVNGRLVDKPLQVLPQHCDC